MAISKRAVGVGLASIVLLSSCVFDGSEPPSDSGDDAAPAPDLSVEVPPERLTAFCQAMTDLSDRIRSGDDVGDDLITETYRSISGDVPVEIADDFALVLEALETGTPPPTDPPRSTIQTVPRPETTPPSSDGTVAPAAPPPPTSESTDDQVAAGDSTVPGSVVVDERFDRDNSPAERINTYVSFTCRDSDNNPGPPATQPLDPPPSTDDN